ncbi:helix-loop-helix DNA-binding domain-containing protein [Phlyctema vagabunda]|uniref:Helix-loop-helix DNA-binding domain-containing protein n=1 Tax=Phlyctema vagabunda TaxID=108571 RepID=A0ABR4PTF5_9HELO
MDTNSMPQLDDFPDDDFIQMYVWWKKNKLQIAEVHSKIPQHTDMPCTESQLSIATSDTLFDPIPFSQYIQHEPDIAPLPRSLPQHPSLFSSLEFDFDKVLMEITPVENTDMSIEVDWNSKLGTKEETICPEANGLSPQSNFDSHDTSSHRPHSATEKRYRANLNEKIATLEGLISKRASSKPSSKTGGSKDSNANSLVPSRIKSGKMRMPRQNKTAVLTQAINYIQDMEKQNCKLRGNVDILKERLLTAKEFLREDIEVEC